MRTTDWVLSNKGSFLVEISKDLANKLWFISPTLKAAEDQVFEDVVKLNVFSLSTWSVSRQFLAFEKHHPHVISKPRNQGIAGR